MLFPATPGADALAGINREFHIWAMVVVCRTATTAALAALGRAVAALANKWGPIVVAASMGISGNARAESTGSHDTFSQNPPLQARDIIPHGRSPYFFPLVPGHKHVLELTEESGERYRRETAVLDQVEVFDVGGIGRFATAVVREEEFAADELLFRVDRWVAIDGSTNNVHIFGEVSWAINAKGHAQLEGIWRVGEADEGGIARPGLLMPASMTVGSRLALQGEVDEWDATVDVVATGIHVTVPAGTFADCVRLRKKPLRGRKKDGVDSVWCPQVGLVFHASTGELTSSTAQSN